ncbi:oxalate/formate MFS antiporter [Bradyrhizobium arachidis]|uniref:oxalate/formate MFS antiporter n=1 Tax=Bradyrhizobium TaxID=374 RepID=UPI00188A5DAA|nr:MULTISPECIES: oxalate/formate MFS antiporter [Bradyrhizobium]MDN4983166.1 oxalate/formate MFS antiporter [Bradyrhizobium sp. WYCCWR 13022]QOZ54065.1 oxalate/formate MFS antiporter [Bradyrhizobium sp. CCBAU 53338]UVO34654.1 oxalate/formate MFS antiporter [Bradyrhizobium arachidis]
MAASMNATSPTGGFRWVQLIVGVVCMAMIANLQYGWTYFVGPMSKANSWDVGSIQIAFSIFVALETWLTPVEGWIVDSLGPQRGPKLMVAAGGLFVAIGWLINAKATSLEMLYLGAVISGVGAGGIYATCVGNAVKWFPDRRGLAVGLTAAGFGAGAAVTVIPIQKMIASIGYADTFFWFALGQGGIIFILAWLLRSPEPSEVPAAGAVKVLQSKTSSTPGQMLASPVFWLLYVMFVLVSASGLMVAAQIALIAKDYGVAQSVVLFGATTLIVSGVIDNLANGGARPFFGWVSDQIGREYTMAIAFTAGGLAYWLLGTAGTTPWTFVICAALIFFTWGEIFSLFPSTCTDMFGPKYATTNTSLLYTAKGLSAFVVPLANVLKSYTGNWHSVFAIAAIMNFAVVGLALFVVRPMRLSISASQDKQERAVGQPAE